MTTAPAIYNIGYTRHGERRHLIAEDPRLQPDFSRHTYALCGARITTFLRDTRNFKIRTGEHWEPGSTTFDNYCRNCVATSRRVPIASPEAAR